MKHAGAAALDALEPLLAAIRRASPDLIERKRGVFYRGAKAALHFHEDQAGLFADWRATKEDTDFLRARVSTAAEQTAFLKRLTGRL